MSTTEKETLYLKWGTLKGYHFRPNSPAHVALKVYLNAGPRSGGAMTQEDTIEQIAALCTIIDAVDGDIISEWSGEKMSKDEAKAYVREYQRPYKVKSNSDGAVAQ